MNENVYDTETIALPEEDKDACLAMTTEDWRGGTLQTQYDGGVMYDVIDALSVEFPISKEHEIAVLRIKVIRSEFHSPDGRVEARHRSEHALVIHGPPTTVHAGWKIGDKEIYLIHSGIPTTVVPAAT